MSTQESQIVTSRNCAPNHPSMHIRFQKIPEIYPWFLKTHWGHFHDDF